VPGTAPVFLVDSSIYVFRAWFTLPDSLTDRHGRPANAVFGFTDFVYRLIDERRPSRIGFAFDQSLKTSFRNEIYPPYKANRESAPEELKQQFLQCRRFLQAAGISEFSSPHYEADDLIGTLARQTRDEGERLTFVTGDKDLAQLVGAHDTWWEFARDKRLDYRGVEKQFGVRPEQIADQLAIAGDKVDNIPGVPGVGMATAAKLLKRFGTLEDMLADIPAIEHMKIRGAKRLMNLIDEHQDTIRLARQLTGIECAADMPDHAPLERGAPDEAALNDWFDEMGISPARRERWRRLLDSPR
jgi:DNA polymerase-1